MSTDPERTQQWHEYLHKQTTDFPTELARCTCGTASFNRDEHADTCPLGPTPRLSNDRNWPQTNDLAEQRF